MKGYKAFKKGLVCKGKQYAENTVFEEPEAVVCRKGMHYCHEPLAVLGYYDLVDSDGNLPEFAEVEPLGEELTDDGTKFCTRKLKIGGKISLAGLIKAQIEYVKEIADSRQGYRATLAGGYRATLAGGDEAKLAGGDEATLAGGDGATLAGGDGATLAGGDGAILVAGRGSVAKAKKGALIVLAKRDENGSICDFCAKIVDGDEIKEDVLYRLDNGTLKEVE